tara:strand:- start:1853 stop:2545 length:693 start_codon:yes stop_codon:yes gene_type:complete
MPLTPHQQKSFRALAAEIEGIDIEVYKRFDRDPLDPIIGLGQRNLRIGFFGRDPGRDEVRHGEPFIGAGGQLVRKALYAHLYGEEMPDFEASKAVGEHFFWINTVPYKPIGNKAWSMKVKRHFHALMNEVLISHWEGRSLITLGREAFLWFGIGRSKDERDRLEAFWKQEDRFESSIEVTLEDNQGEAQVFTLYPLPHPSPLNQTWYSRFPGLLKQRLEQLDVRQHNLTL